MSGMTYRGSGVDYDAMDPFKREAQLAGLGTTANLARFGYNEVNWSRGESCYLIETPWGYIGHVEEGLGTKNTVADQFGRRSDIGIGIADELRFKLQSSFYDKAARCCVAMIVNDLITLGVLPVSVLMHLAVGESRWFDDEERARDLIRGWSEACNLAGAVWGGGETPTLKDQVIPGAAVLNGSSVGVIQDRSWLVNPTNIRDGDIIVAIFSSGIHANGLTLARQIASQQPKGYLEELSDGRTYGEALLEPTLIYVPIIESCQKEGYIPHYAINITGHGWRKLMRATQPFVYVVDRVPDPNPVFRFIQERGGVSDEEMYGNYNMGAGFALIVSPENADATMFLARKAGFKAMDVGYVEKRGDEKKVVIEPLGLTYNSLAVR